MNKNKITNFFFGNNSNQELVKIIKQIKTIKKDYESIAFCLNNTNSSWLGVKMATLNLFPNNSIILPAYYSNILLNNSQLNTIISEISRYKFKQIILSGYTKSLNDFIKNLSFTCEVNLIYHGALSELIEEEKDIQFKKIIDFCNEGVINKIGFVKSGLAEWAIKLFKLKAYHITLYNKKRMPKNLNFINESKINIGIFGSPNFNKNIFTQISAALSIENSIIHTFKIPETFLTYSNRIVKHNQMNNDNLLDLMGNMRLCLHLSFSEGMGGQTFTEPLSMGIPCLTSYNNEFFENSKYLMDLLIVDQYDNPSFIVKKINQVLQLDQNKLQKIIYNYNDFHNKKTSKLLKQFLN